jgi:hypothetical protein
MMRQVSSPVRRGARGKGQQWTSPVAYPALNVVMSSKPKMLTGLSQKALERVQGLDNTLSWTRHAPGGERAPNPFGSTLRNVVSPYCSWKGREAARPTDGGAGRGVGKSECHPVMGWIRVATSPDAQAG